MVFIYLFRHKVISVSEIKEKSQCSHLPNQWFSNCAWRGIKSKNWIIGHLPIYGE